MALDLRTDDCLSPRTPSQKIYDRYGRRIAKWGWHDMQDRSRSSSISGQQKMLQHAHVLEHSLENRENVECISQFAMLLRACNRQSP